VSFSGLRDSHLKTAHAPADMAPVNHTPVCRGVGKCARNSHLVTLIQLFPGSSVHDTSRSEGPVGRQLPFGMGIALSASLPDGLRFFRHLVPAYPTAPLTVRLPHGRIDGVAKFHFHECVGLGACPRPGSLRSTMPQLGDDRPASGAFWPKPDNLFGLFLVTTFITDSALFTLPTI
jgi:hypothetical protein